MSFMDNPQLEMADLTQKRIKRVSRGLEFLKIWNLSLPLSYYQPVQPLARILIAPIRIPDLVFPGKRTRDRQVRIKNIWSI